MAELAGGSSPFGVVATDVDNDGDTDLVVSRKNVDDVQILVNAPENHFPAGTVAMWAVAVRLELLPDPAQRAEVVPPCADQRAAFPTQGEATHPLRTPG